MTPTTMENCTITTNLTHSKSSNKAIIAIAQALGRNAEALAVLADQITGAAPSNVTGVQIVQASDQ